VAPTKELRGKSAVGWYGDFVSEVDGVVGQVLEALEKSGVAGDTLVFLASDNGFAPYVGYITDEAAKSDGRSGPQQLEGRGHFPSAGWRGYKFDAWEGGHHIPLVARWPGKVKAGSRCEQTICLNDLMATCAELTGAKLPDNAGEDSVSMLPALLGTATGALREATVHASGNGVLALRQGEWKLIFSRQGGAGRNGQNFELYNLKDDRAETKNVADEQPEVVARMKALMARYVREGRSTPGVPQRNTDPQQWPQLWWMDGYAGPMPKDAAAGKGKKNGPQERRGQKRKKAAGKQA
jgi:arylsulfatase A-like enzyme